MSSSGSESAHTHTVLRLIRHVSTHLLAAVNNINDQLRIHNLIVNAAVELRARRKLIVLLRPTFLKAKALPKKFCCIINLTAKDL